MISDQTMMYRIFRIARQQVHGRIGHGGPGRVGLVAAALLSFVTLFPSPSAAVSTRVVATVNDKAISAYQVKQRVKLLKVLRPQISRKSSKQQEREALKALIDDVLKNEEAKKRNFLLTGAQLDKLLTEASGVKNLAERLTSRGLSERLVKSYIITRMSWNRIVSRRYGQQTVNDAQVDARFQQITQEIKKQAAAASVTIYNLLPITLPVERQSTPELTQEVARSRMIEAQRLVQRFRSCGAARKAARGIFNVRIGKRIPADPRRMPKQMKRTLDRQGPGSAFVMGVAPDASAVQIMAYCGKKRVAPEAPKITRDMVKQRIEDERYENLGRSYLRDLRKNAFIEYKDAGLSN
ncbi:MAG: SurA N-terminal domain-containing protein [Pseudomonadota bacterium]